LYKGRKAIAMLTKYYVVNGEKRFITLAENFMGACVNMLLSQQDSAELDHYFYVDERGFRGKGEGPIKSLHVDKVFRAAGFDIMDE
jgi:hypothetical protein